jgi:hypothetical protein
MNNGKDIRRLSETRCPYPVVFSRDQHTVDKIGG